MKARIGKVISDKPHKTISVAVEWLKSIPKYKTTLRRHTKLMAHDEHNEARTGDVVAIESCRPISKQKSWRLQDILHRAKTLG